MSKSIKTGKSTLIVARDHPSNAKHSFDVLFGSDDSEWDALFANVNGSDEGSRIKTHGHALHDSHMKFCTHSEDDEELFTSNNCFSQAQRQQLSLVSGDLFDSDDSECNPLCVHAADKGSRLCHSKSNNNTTAILGELEDKELCDSQPKGCSATFDALFGSDDSEEDDLFECSSDASKLNVSKSGCGSSHSKTRAVKGAKPISKEKLCALFGDSEDDEGDIFPSNNFPGVVLTQPLQHQLAFNGLFDSDDNECNSLCADAADKGCHSKSNNDTDTNLGKIEDKELFKSSSACDSQPPNAPSAKLVSHNGCSATFDTLFGSDDSEWDDLFECSSDASKLNVSKSGCGSSHSKTRAVKGAKPISKENLCALFEDSEDDEGDIFPSNNFPGVVLTQPLQHQLAFNGLFDSDDNECNSLCADAADKGCHSKSDNDTDTNLGKIEDKELFKSSSACDSQPPSAKLVSHNGCSATFDTLFGSDDSEWYALFKGSSDASKLSVSKSDKGCGSSHSKTHAVEGAKPASQQKPCALFGDSEDDEEESNDLSGVAQPLQLQQHSLASSAMFDSDESECDPGAADKSSYSSKSKNDSDAMLGELEDKKCSSVHGPQPASALDAKFKGSATSDTASDNDDKPPSHTLSDDAANVDTNSMSKADSLFGDSEDNEVVASSKRHQKQSSGVFDSDESECDAGNFGANIKSCTDKLSHDKPNDDLGLKENVEH